MEGITAGHVAADGSVALKHPGFKRRWAGAMGEILDWDEGRGEDPIVITRVEDGSGVGCAIVVGMEVWHALLCMILNDVRRDHSGRRVAGIGTPYLV